MRMSESITEIAKALSKFQGEVENPKNTASNPYFSSMYAPLSGILDIAKEALAKNGLSVVQFPGGNGTTVHMTTLLLHETGEWIESGALVMTPALPKVKEGEPAPTSPTPQAMGSAITYARRYQLSAVLGVSSEDDDDGNATEPEKPKKAPKTDGKQRGDSSLTDAQANLVGIWMSKGGLSQEERDKVREYHGVDKNRDLTKSQMDSIKNWLVEKGFIVFRKDESGRELAYSPDEIAADENPIAQDHPEMLDGEA